MRFHGDVHGCSVRISSDRLSAKRVQGAAPYNGLVTSRDPLAPGAWVCLLLTQTSDWIGCLRLGVTRFPPDALPSLANQDVTSKATFNSKALPKFACPDWSNRPGVWLRPVTDLVFAGEGDVKLSFNVNSAGQLHFYINGVHKGQLFSDLPVNEALWLLLELYGDTQAVRILPQNDTPMEVSGRGERALSAYHRACETGTRAVFRTRLMLVGEDGAGKTSLMKALTGQKTMQSELSTPNIDLSASCSFPARNGPASDPWRLTRSAEIHAPRWPSAPSLHEDGAGDFEDLFEQHVNALTPDAEDEYRECSAQNATLEILLPPPSSDPVALRTSKAAPAASSSSSSSSSGGHRSPRTAEKKAPAMVTEPVAVASAAEQEALSSVPRELGPRVLQLLRAAKEKRRRQGSRGHGAGDAAGEVTLNIWDFGGQVIYYTTHQLFLTHRAVYLIVFNLEHDLDDSTNHPVVGNYQDASVFTHMDYLDYWLHLIHSHVAQAPPAVSPDLGDLPDQPPIFVVGTHAGSLGGSEAAVREKAETCFARVREHIRYKSYARHVLPEFYVVENGEGGQGFSQLTELRAHVERVVRAQPYMGEMIPVKWLRLERLVEDLRQHGTRLVWLTQMLSMAQEEGLYSEEDVVPALEFLHDLGTIVHFGRTQASASRLHEMVILDPQWLVELFRKVLSAKPVDLNASMKTGEAWLKLCHTAVLEERLLDAYWGAHRHEKLALIGLMEKFDLTAERLPNPADVVTPPLERSFFVPSLLKPWTASDPTFYDSPNGVIFYLRFQYFLPDGLFQRLLTRSIRWSQEQGGRDPVLYYNKAWFFVDQEHDFALEMHAYRLSRIKVSVYRVNVAKAGSPVPREGLPERPEDQPALPSPMVVAKVRRFLETVLEELRRLWMRRMAYQVMVTCPCGQLCEAHSVAHCRATDCLHFLNLDECLSNSIVCCGHRRVRTDQWKSWFPTSMDTDVFAAPILPNHVISQDVWNIEVQKGSFLPHWMKAAAKLLNGAVDGQDWRALAEQLGYNEARITRFHEDLNPALLLLADWVVTNGNTHLAVDMLVACLCSLGRSDIAEAIEGEREADADAAQVFISYQWDSQAAVLQLRARLERAGFRCWMDVGQMAGGDVLLARVERALRRSRVVIAVVTPRAVVSAAVVRELCLADLLRRPVLPVLLERTPWPPPGPLALVLSQFVYVDLCGVGGHGGSGALADREARFGEILAQVGKFASADRLPPAPRGDPPSATAPPQPPPPADSDSEGPAEPPREAGAAAESPELAAGVQADRPSPLPVAHVRRCIVCSLL